jgi:squalene-associated FAD-dependent desaturase
MTDVAIIGGGTAGLAAALRLVSAGVKVRLYEARHIAGGRTFSVPDPESGMEVDNGQHLLMGCYRDTLRYLADAGGAAGLRHLPRLRIPFLHTDGRKGTLAAGALPPPLGHALAFLRYSLLDWPAKRAVLSLALHLRTLRIDSIPELDEISAESWLRGRRQTDSAVEALWEPVILATMNTTADRASAAVFVRVLREIFLGSAGASSLLLPERGLSRVLVDPALARISERGGEVFFGRAVRSLRAEGDAIRLQFRDGGGEQAASVLCAVPPWKLGDVLASSELLPGIRRILPHFEPSSILSVHFWTDRPVTNEPMTGLLGGTLQWLFAKGRDTSGMHMYSCTVSAPGALIEQDGQVIGDLLGAELMRSVPGFDAGGIRRVLPLRERRATFVPRPGLDAVRPAARTPVRGLYLAGDWTATGLPATIEGAVRSGHLAADAILTDMRAV